MSISEQIGDGPELVGDQVDLAKWEGWRVEPRGRGGQWQRGPASLADQIGAKAITGRPRSTPAQRSSRGRSIQTQIGEGLGRSRMAGRSRQQMTERAQAIAALRQKDTEAERQAEHERMRQNQIKSEAAIQQAHNMVQTRQLHKQQQEDLEGQIRTLERAVRRSNQTILEMQKQEKETEQKAEAAAEAVQGQKDANKKALIEGTVAIAGALVAFLTAGLGLPLVATLAIGLLGPEYQVFQEWRDHL